jgi:carbonic anhydrase
MARLNLVALIAALVAGAFLPTTAMAIDCGPEGGVSPNVRFIQQNTGPDFRELVIGAVGEIPEAGTALSLITSFIWPEPESESSAVFDQMKAYVDQLVPELIAQERATQLEQRLAGLHRVLRDYNRTSYGTAQKGQWFTSLLALLDQAEPFFFDARTPEKSLTYFVPMGTLRIFALREQYLYYERIYGHADPDRARHLHDLKAAIDRYTQAALRAKETAIRWRVEDKIGLDTRQERGVGVLGPTTTTIWTAADRVCSWQQSFQHNSLGGGDLYGQEHATTALAQRRAQVQFAYLADLNLLMSPAALWPYLDPTNPDDPAPTQAPVFANSGPFGSTSRYEAAFDDDPKGQAITRIVVYAGSRVDGVEVFYGGRSGGLHGQRGGNTYALDLLPGETIVSAHGQAGEAMDSLYFTTSRGRDVGGGAQGGGPHGTPWSAAPPQGSEAILYKVSGRQGARHLAGLSLTWQYFPGGEKGYRPDPNEKSFEIQSRFYFDDLQEAAIRAGNPACSAAATKQSPLNIDTSRVAVDSSLSPLVIKYIQYPPGDELAPTVRDANGRIISSNMAATYFEVRNTGNTVEFDVDPDHYRGRKGPGTERVQSTPPKQQIVVDGRSFTLTDFHFHRPSEHLINNRRYAMEIQLVHKADTPVTGGVNEVILSVLGELGPGNAALSSVAGMFRNVPRTRPVWAIQRADVDLPNLFPTNRNYVRYDGSLTVPPCTNNVVWYVFTTPIQIHPATVDGFRFVIPFNARAKQNVHNTSPLRSARQ